MGESNRQTDSERERDAEVSRRGFLTSSSVLLVSHGHHLNVGPSSAQKASTALEDFTLSRDDLVAPEQDTYTEVPVDLDDASLVQFLRDAVTGFEEQAGVATGFMARQNNDVVPLYVESAAFEADGDAVPDIFEAVASWVQATHATNDKASVIDVERGIDVAQWNVVVSGDWLDSMYIQCGNNIVSFITTFGDMAAKVDPLTAVGHYAQIMRE